MHSASTQHGRTKRFFAALVLTASLLAGGGLLAANASDTLASTASGSAGGYGGCELVDGEWRCYHAP